MSFEYMIDSSAWIEYLSGSTRGEKIREIVEQREIASSIISIVEVADKFERNRRDFGPSLRFIKNRASILPLTMTIALRAAKLKNEFRRKNSKFGLADGIHLATAYEEDATLVTTDSDFTDADKVLLI